MRYILAGLVLLLSACSRGDTREAGQSTRPAFTFTQLVTGKSMLPAFGEFEVVKVSLDPYSSLKRGDTVIRWHELTHQYIHHRVDTWDSTTGAWFTRGDNNSGPDRSRMFSYDYVGRTDKLQ